MISAKDRYNRILTLRELGAPAWIIKLEQLQLKAIRANMADEVYESLLNKHVRPLMNGHGYIMTLDEESHEH